MTQINDFSFRTVPQLICAPGAAALLGEHITAQFPLVRRVLMVSDDGLQGTGLLSEPQHSLEQRGLAVYVYAGVVADPPDSVVRHAAEYARAQEIDLVVGIGGGSSMDVAKLVAVLAAGKQSLSQLYGIGKVVGTRLPLVQVPTTAGTGSEATNIAIVTTGETTRTAVIAPQLFADMAILDARLTLSLPPVLTAAGGLEAMVHAIEAYTSRFKKNPLSDLMARQALSLLSANLITASEHGDKLEARQAMLLGANYAGQAFANAPVAAVHALASPIGGVFDVAHGLSNVLVLPHVLRFNLPHALEHYAELAGVIAPHVGGSVEARAEALIVAMQQLAKITGVACKLEQVGVRECDLDRLADEAMLQTRLLRNNPRELSRADALDIYRAAL